jgi:hypothetical protein
MSFSRVSALPPTGPSSDSSRAIVGYSICDLVEDSVSQLGPVFHGHFFRFRRCRFARYSSAGERSALRRIWRVALQTRPCSADRTQSLARVSRKREYSALLPETFGNFSLQFQELGVRRLTPKSRKPAISGLFSYYRPDILEASDCLADLRGFELAHSRSEKAL